MRNLIINDLNLKNMLSILFSNVFIVRPFIHFKTLVIIHFYNRVFPPVSKGNVGTCLHFTCDWLSKASLSSVFFCVYVCVIFCFLWAEYELTFVYIVVFKFSVCCSTFFVAPFFLWQIKKVSRNYCPLLDNLCGCNQNVFPDRLLWSVKHPVV